MSSTHDTSWRCSGDRYGFDELSISDMQTTIERMNGTTMDVHFGSVHLAVWRDRRGVIRVRLIEGRLEE